MASLSALCAKSDDGRPRRWSVRGCHGWLYGPHRRIGASIARPEELRCGCGRILRRETDFNSNTVCCTELVHMVATLAEKHATGQFLSCFGWTGLAETVWSRQSEAVCVLVSSKNSIFKQYPRAIPNTTCLCLRQVKARAKAKKEAWHHVELWLPMRFHEVGRSLSMSIGGLLSRVKTCFPMTQ